ncbi:MAG: hypothetical protein IT563_12700 [Alphaproteobacteria bacterium]|nr:hypothetical protein [Alphaproteobacteria bacterium]
MSIRFDVQVRVFEDGRHAYDQQVRFQLNDVIEPIAASQRMVEEFARGYHGMKDPTPGDLSNVTCNELFHLLRDSAPGDERRTLFVSGSLLRLCALPEQAQFFSGLGRHPRDGERVLLTIQRENLANERARHSASVVSLDVADMATAGTA